MVAVNYVGEELWSFYNAPWEKRVDLARQLMDIAEQLTNNDFDFALYLLDVSFDNFAVGPRDGKVIVVDAENVLVADKRLIKQSESQGRSLGDRSSVVVVAEILLVNVIIDLRPQVFPSERVAHLSTDPVENTRQGSRKGLWGPSAPLL